MIGDIWIESADGDPHAYAIYRRHYSSNKNPRPKQRQFVGPGERIVLFGFFCVALFVWTKRIRDDGQDGVNCSVFRNESDHRSSDMILEAEQWAWLKWPGERLFTMVNAEKTARRRGKRNPPGMCFIAAGWRECGRTKKGLVILEKLAG
ncbi:MAG TPA: hypothetical protein VFE62_20915 [Gemmataceae bacterium]|nr:hypothetical protein [Gemmataceae bacterium]